jgi:hypothetical protein
MTRWQKTGLAISILWLIGLSIFLVVVHSTWKTVVNILVAGNLDTLTLWTVMLAPVVILWSIMIITVEVGRWIRRRQTTAEQDGEGAEEPP